MYSTVLRVLPAERALHRNGTSLQHAPLSTSAASRGRVSSARWRALSTPQKPLLSSELRSYRACFQKPNSISSSFQNVKDVGFNLKSPLGSEEPGIACLRLEMRLLESWAFALTFEGSREGTILHSCSKCMPGFISLRIGSRCQGASTGY